MVDLPSFIPQGGGNEGAVYFFNSSGYSVRDEKVTLALVEMGWKSVDILYYATRAPYNDDR